MAEQIKPVPKPPKDVQSESSKLEQENARKDAFVLKGQKNYEAGEKTRLKDQGSSFFKKGGTASSRGDGCACRGKTRGQLR